MADEGALSPAAPRRLPMGVKVHLGVGGLLSLIVASVLLAISLVARLQHNEADLDRRDVPYAAHVAVAALNAKGIANDQRGFLLAGDAGFLGEADGRLNDARLAFEAAASTASDGAQRAAITQARAGFERWVRAVHAEIATFQTGNRQAAITASLGPDRALRKDYERSLTDAEALGASSIRSAQTSFAAALSRSVRILCACLLVAVVIGIGVGAWLVRSIALPLYRLVAILAADDPV
jgi:methyl-accepting chemotaxis protein